MSLASPYIVVSPPPVTALIVNFNAGELLTEGVRALLAEPVVNEVVVADNASVDASLARLAEAFPAEPRLRILRNEHNLGFARANNRALAHARGEYLLFINPDCRVAPGAVGRVLAALESHPRAGMAGGLILHPDGREQAGGRRLTPTPGRALAQMLGLHRFFPGDARFTGVNLAGTPLPTGPVAVEAISGAFMLVRRTALHAVGPLDEGYFMHCEDLDWCLRMRRHGWEVLFVPDAEITHAKGASSRSRPVRVEYYKHRGMTRFYAKFFRRQYPVALYGLVVAAVWVRFGAVAARLWLRRLSRPAKPDPGADR